MLSIVRVTAENYSKFLSLYSEYISEDTDTGNSIIEVKEWEAMKQDGMFTIEYFSSYRLLQVGSQVKGFVQVRQMFPHRRRLLHQYMV